MGAWGVPSVLGAARGGWERVSGFVVTRERYGRLGVRRSSAWAKEYLRKAAVVDFGCAIVAVFAAVQLRFGNDVRATYIALSLALPVLWLAALWLAGGYDVRFVGTGSDEYRKVLNAGVGLTAAVALFSYTVNLQLSRSYVLIALPSVTMFDLVARYVIRKRLHRQRASGLWMLSVVAVGHEPAVADLVTELGRDRYHGLTVVGACVAQPSGCSEIAGVPVYGGLDDVAAAVRQIRRGYRSGARLPGNGRHQAPQPGLGAGENRYRPVRLARAARRRRPADNDQADGRADSSARGSSAANRHPLGHQGSVRPVCRRGRR